MPNLWWLGAVAVIVLVASAIGILSNRLIRPLVDRTATGSAAATKKIAVFGAAFSYWFLVFFVGAPWLHHQLNEYLSKRTTEILNSGSPWGISFSSLFNGVEVLFLLILILAMARDCVWPFVPNNKRISQKIIDDFTDWNSRRAAYVFNHRRPIMISLGAFFSLLPLFVILFDMDTSNAGPSGAENSELPKVPQGTSKEPPANVENYSLKALYSIFAATLCGFAAAWIMGEWITSLKATRTELMKVGAAVWLASMIVLWGSLFGGRYLGVV